MTNLRLEVTTDTDEATWADAITAAGNHYREEESGGELLIVRSMEIRPATTTVKGKHDGGDTPWLFFQMPTPESVFMRVVGDVAEAAADEWPSGRAGFPDERFYIDEIQMDRGEIEATGKIDTDPSPTPEDECVEFSPHGDTASKIADVISDGVDDIPDDGKIRYVCVDGAGGDRAVAYYHEADGGDE